MNATHQPATSNIIDIESLRSFMPIDRSIRDDLLTEDVSREVDVISTEDHRAEPIKSIEEIYRVCDYLKSNRRYRDYLFFIIGINSGLRVSDILRLEFGHLCYQGADGKWYFRENFPILEKKTRKKTNHVNRYVTINQAVQEAVKYYLECYVEDHGTLVKTTDYLFTSNSRRNKGTDPKPLTRKSAHRIMVQIAKECELTGQISTHSLRKTFGYHFAQNHDFDNKALTLLQSIFNHENFTDTLRYIGLTAEETAAAYMTHNLGLESNNPANKYIDSEVITSSDVSANLRA